MLLTPMPLAGAFVVDPASIADARGYFARLWQPDALAAHGLHTNLAQASLSHNRAAGTLRGMHYQRPPFAETKLIRCTRGALYDVLVDVRPGSSTYGSWFGVELTAENGRMVYAPEGLAHGYLTLADDTDVLYFLSAPYSAAHAAGIRWNDPRIGIEWPGGPRVISDRDAALPGLAP
jgi:dTDP-4-dehydrorhamnose 3,5-epimerase